MLQQAAHTFQGVLLDPFRLDSLHRVTLGPARFLDPDQTPRALLLLLGLFDLFVLWSTVLLAVGVRAARHLPGDRAAVAAALVWALGAFPARAGALR